MKNILIFISFLLPLTIIGQQDIILTNYSFNPMFFNPAVCGSTGEGAGSVVANYRNQWVGLEGSPKTIMMGGELNLFNDRVGVGLNVARETIGIDSRIDLATNYAYRIKMDEAYLALGLRVGMHFFNSKLSNIRSNDPSDVVYGQGDIGFNIFSVGAGAYYYRDNFFVGTSVPALAAVGSGNNGFKSRHFYLHTGAIFDMSEYSEVQLEPSILVKYQSAAPIQFTVGAKLWLIKEFNIGAFYRSNDAFALSSEFVVMDQLSIGASYDFTRSDLKDQQDGTLELLLAYKFNYGLNYIPMGKR